jgi:tRNA dimethylallyltransferase
MSGAESSFKRRAVLIAGPTASGKSALALALAERCGGVVINADSMQVYADLRIITARPDAEAMGRVPHRLYGHVDAAENYSAGRWLKDARAVLEEAGLAGRLPILVGGTGLYFKLLTTGLADIPEIPGQVRAAVRARIAAEGAPAVHTALAMRDPAGAARINVADESRLVRALEVLEATGRPLADWQRENLPAVLDPAESARVFLSPDREALRRRIEARFDAMLMAGALDEVRALGARHLEATLPAMKAHGVPWLIRHLAGETSLEEAATEARADTRRYAKRQFTWFRNQMPDWPWEAPEKALDALLRQLEG